MSRQFYCEICGGLFNKPAKGNKRLFCDDCKPQAEKLYQAEYYRRKKAEAEQMRADAALGAAVRRIPNDHVLQRSDWQGKEKWFLSGYECPDGCRGELRTRGRGDTPEDALTAAGLMKGEKQNAYRRA